MADVYFKCRCGKSLAVDECGVGMTVRCVDCRAPVRVSEFDMEFACEGCQATLLASAMVAGDLIKCALCGHRMTVPVIEEEQDWISENHGERADDGVNDAPCANKAEPTVPTAKHCMDALMNRRSGFQVRRKPVPEPMRVGWLFRLALLVMVSVATGELVYLFIHGRSLVVMPEQTSHEAINPRVTEMRSARRAAIGPPAPEATGLPADSAGEPEMILAAISVGETKAEKSVAAKEPVRISSASHVPVPVKDADGLTAPRSAGSNALASVSAPDPLCGITVTKDGIMLRKMPDRADQPVELIAIMDEWVELDKLRRKGGRETQTDAFVRRVHECRKKLNEYTASHSGGDLNAEFWAPAFWNLYEYSSGRAASSYQQAEEIVREGLDILAGAIGENELVVNETALLVVQHHLYHWLKTHPSECADLMEEYEARVRALDSPSITRLWKMDAPLLEAALWARADKVDSSGRDWFVARREKRLTGYLTDPGVDSFTRGKALRSWATKAVRLGCAESVAQAMETLGKIEVVSDNGPDYYFGRMWAALYGSGDWETACGAMSAVTKLVLNGKLAANDSTYRQMTEMYYTRIFSPGYELKRQAAAK